MWYLVVVYNSFDPEFPKAITTPHQCFYTISSRKPGFITEHDSLHLDYTEIKIERRYDFRVYGQLIFDFITEINDDYLYILNITCDDANTIISLNPPTYAEGRGEG